MGEKMDSYQWAGPGGDRALGDSVTRIWHLYGADCCYELTCCLSREARQSLELIGWIAAGKKAAGRLLYGSSDEGGCH